MVLGVPVESILTLLLGTVIGFTMHVFFKVSEIREKSDSSMTPWQYFARAPYKTGFKGLAVLSASIGLAKPEITPVLFAMAVSIGYAADSAVNHLKR